MSAMSNPARAVRAVTCSDTVDIPTLHDRYPVALLVTTATIASIIDETNTQVDNVPLQAGYNPIRVRRVRATGTTTTTGIFALHGYY